VFNIGFVEALVSLAVLGFVIAIVARIRSGWR